MKVSVDKLVANCLNALPERQRDVLLCRYGIKDGREMTLAALGARYKVTRERIRQIQNLGLAHITKEAASSGLAEFAGAMAKHLDGVGGIRREDTLLTDIAYLITDNGAKETLKNRVRFVMEAGGVAQFYQADRGHHALWHLNKDHLKKADVFVAKFASTLSVKKEDVLANKKFDTYFAQVAKQHGVADMVGLNYVSASKQFMVSQYGDAGLSAWAEIYPRTSRDWAYLVIKKEGKPLHFTDIAGRINAVRKQKKTNFQTVHNELIKDERFVLVGRGLYGLREFGILPGTAREVIAHFLKKHGKMKSHEVVATVVKERTFKPNTILLNLQNKKHFVRLSDGYYTIREA